MTELAMGVAVSCTDGPGGETTAAIVNPITRQITHLGIKFGGEEYLVDMDAVGEASDTGVQLACTQDELQAMERFSESHYVPPSAADYVAYGAGEWQSPYATTTIMPEYVVEVVERVPEGELAVHRGDSVEAVDGHVGFVEEFLVEGDCHTVTHLVINERHPWGKRLIAVPVSQIDQPDDFNVIHLKLDKEGVQALPGVPIKRHYKRHGTSGQPMLMAYVFAGANMAAEMASMLDEEYDELGIHSTAILTRDAAGETTLNDSSDPKKGKSRAVGVLIGGLTGLLAGPIGAALGAAIGAGAGNVVANLVDLGLSNDFLAGLQAHLDADTSALVVVVEQNHADHLSGLVAGAKGVILEETCHPKRWSNSSFRTMPDRLHPIAADIRHSRYLFSPRPIGSAVLQ